MARTKSIKFPNSQDELSGLFDKLQRSTLQQVLKVGTLAIHGSASAVVKETNAVYYQIDGSVYKLAAGDLAALSGTVVNGTFNAFMFTVNSSGTTKSYMGTAASTLAGVVFPTAPDGEVVLGFVIINPTGTGNFVGGTTALDDATVVPNAVYIDNWRVLPAVRHSVIPKLWALPRVQGLRIKSLSMKAVIISAEKQMLPRYSAATNQDEPTLMVVTMVEFRLDDGTPYHTQTYARLPEELGEDPKAYFQAQADAMQADIEHGKVQSAVDASSKLADDKINQLMQ